VVKTRKVAAVRLCSERRTPIRLEYPTAWRYSFCRGRTASEIPALGPERSKSTLKFNAPNNKLRRPDHTVPTPECDGQESLKHTVHYWHCLASMLQEENRSRHEKRNLRLAVSRLSLG
jgi:hypothetical protein